MVLNGAAVNFVAFSSPFLRADSQLALGLDGQLITLFIIVLAAMQSVPNELYEAARLDTSSAWKTKDPECGPVIPGPSAQVSPVPE